MSSMSPPPPPPASPIVAPMEAPPARGGCLRVALIGCGSVALLCIAAFVGLFLYTRKNPGIFIDFAMGQIERNYGPDVTEEDKKELREAVADFKQAAREKRIRDRQDGGFPRTFNVRSGHEKVTHDDVQQMIRVFREAIVPAPSSAPSSSPAAAPTPS